MWIKCCRSLEQIMINSYYQGGVKFQRSSIWAAKDSKKYWSDTKESLTGAEKEIILLGCSCTWWCVQGAECITTHFYYKAC